MKKVLIACTMLVFIFSACKKNKDSKYYFKMKIDGQWHTFTNVYAELGPDLGNPSLTDLVVQGDNGEDLMSISIQDDEPIPTGTYDTDNFSDYWIVVDYWRNLNNPQVFELDGDGFMPDPRFLVTISSITETEIRGSFTGNYLYDNWDEEVLNVTEGEFVARRID